MKSICTFIVTILVTSCGLYWGEEPHDLRLKNNSKQEIVFYFPSTYDYSTNDFPCKVYPDTTISFPWWFTSGPAKPSEYVTADRGLVEGAYVVYNVDTLSLFVLDYKLIEGKIWVEDSKDGGYWRNDAWLKAMEETDVLLRYDLSINDMNRFRDKTGMVTLYYPPTPEMKDVKMWPPYEEAIKNAETLKP